MSNPTPTSEQEMRDRLNKALDKCTTRELEWINFFLGEISTSYESGKQAGREELKAEIWNFKEENKTDDKIAALFCGMKIISSPLVPKDQIWFNDGQKEYKFSLLTKEIKQ